MRIRRLVSRIPHRMHHQLWRMIMVSGVVLTACGGGGSSNPSAPTVPSSPTFNFTGHWFGTATDEGGPGALTLDVTDTNGTVTGTETSKDAGSGVTSTGTIRGTVTAGTLAFTITISAGGYSGAQGLCEGVTGVVTGTARIADAILIGSYGGAVCGGDVHGTFQLTKQ